MAKRKGKRRPREPAATVEYRDADGNVLVLRRDLSPATIRKIREPGGVAASSPDDVWHRRAELVFERLAVSWEIAGMPLTDQKMLLGRYRMADDATRRWVQSTIAAHLEAHIPELASADR
jgi:hypothetical protein